MTSQSAGPQLNVVYEKPKKNYMLPKHIQDSALSSDEARALLAAMSTSGKYAPLSNTRFDLNGLEIKGLKDRIENNPRLTGFKKWVERHMPDAEGYLPDKTQGMSDSYIPDPDIVSVPSGNPGVAMHELGHAIDMNDFPSGSAIRRSLAGYYRYAPRLILEHAAWRKGRKAVHEAVAADKIPLDLAVKVMKSAIPAKRVGLGSYWGSAVGTAAGVAGGIGTVIGLERLTKANIPARLGIPVALVGGVLGGMGGLEFGKFLGRKEVPDDKVIKLLAKDLAKRTNRPVEDVQKELTSRLSDFKAARHTTLKEGTGPAEAMTGAGLAAKIAGVAFEYVTKQSMQKKANTGKWLISTGVDAARSVASPVKQTVKANIKNMLPAAGDLASPALQDMITPALIQATELVKTPHDRRQFLKMLAAASIVGNRMQAEVNANPSLVRNALISSIRPDQIIQSATIGKRGVDTLGVAKALTQNDPGKWALLNGLLSAVAPEGTAAKRRLLRNLAIGSGAAAATAGAGYLAAK